MEFPEGISKKISKGEDIDLEETLKAILWAIIETNEILELQTQCLRKLIKDMSFEEEPEC